MSTQTRAVVDKLLTNVSNKLVPQGYISEMILPELSVVQTTGKLGKYGNGHLRIVNTRVGGRSAYPMADRSSYDSTVYSLENHALKDVITEEDLENVEKPFDAEKDSTDDLTSRIWLDKERSLAVAMQDTAVFTQNTTLSGTSQYNDYSSSDPLGDFKTARIAVRGGCGFMPNVAWCDSDVAETLRFHPALLDSLGYKDSRPGGLNDQELARALSVDMLFIAEAVYNSAKEGQADVIAPVWGKHLWFAHSPRKAQVRQQALGYRLQKAGQKPRQVFKFMNQEPVNSRTVIVKDKFQQLFTNTNCAYLIEDAIV